MLLRSTAQVVSWIFHPLMILTYMICLSMIINPYAFGINQIGEGRSTILIMYVFLQATLIPGISISMMKTLGLVPDWNMEGRYAKIGPFIAAGILYLWLFINFNRLPDVPPAFKTAILGTVLALFTAFVLTLLTKISLHAVGMGSLVGMIIITMLLYSYNTFQWGDQMYSLYTVLFGTVILAGLVGSARLILRRMSMQELAMGYIVGFATQLIALQF